MRPVDAQSIEEGVTLDATGLEPRVALRASRHLSPTPCLSARSSDGETCSSSPRRRRARMPPPRSPSSSDISSCVAPRGTLLDRASARHSARMRAHASGITDGPPSSIDCASAGRTHHSLHPPRSRFRQVRVALTAVERLTVDGQYLIAQHGPFLTAHGQESGSMVELDRTRSDRGYSSQQKFCQTGSSASKRHKTCIFGHTRRVPWRGACGRRAATAGVRVGPTHHERPSPPSAVAARRTDASLLVAALVLSLGATSSLPAPGLHAPRLAVAPRSCS